LGQLGQQGVYLLTGNQLLFRRAKQVVVFYAKGSMMHAKHHNDRSGRYV
jgi:hypothetical protein